MSSTNTKMNSKLSSFICCALVALAFSSSTMAAPVNATAPAIPALPISAAPAIPAVPTPALPAIPAMATSVAPALPGIPTQALAMTSAASGIIPLPSALPMVFSDTPSAIDVPPPPVMLPIEEAPAPSGTGPSLPSVPMPSGAPTVPSTPDLPSAPSPQAPSTTDPTTLIDPRLPNTPTLPGTPLPINTPADSATSPRLVVPVDPHLSFPIEDIHTRSVNIVNTIGFQGVIINHDDGSSNSQPKSAAVIPAKVHSSSQSNTVSKIHIGFSDSSSNSQPDSKIHHQVTPYDQNGDWFNHRRDLDGEQDPSALPVGIPNLDIPNLPVDVPTPDSGMVSPNSVPGSA